MTAEQLLRALDEKGHLVLADVEARFGMFEDLEAFCVEHGIPFDRHSDARYEFDAENVMFRPGMKSPLVISSNNAGDDLFNAEAIRPVAKELARLLDRQVDQGKTAGGGGEGDTGTEQPAAARGRAAAGASSGLIGSVV